MRRFALACTFLLTPAALFAASTSVVPESGSFVLLALGLVSVALIRRRQG